MNSTKNTAHQTITGRIAYLSDRPADAGRERGWEDFSISVFADKTMTLRACSVIADPPHVVRDVTQTVGADMQPQDCFVRVRTGGAYTGSGWFRWGEGTAEGEAFTAAEGRVHEHDSYGPGPVIFCNHSIVGDAWMTAAYPFAQGTGITAISNMYTASRNKQGATGPSLNRLFMGLMWQGTETITVKAGQFEVNKFRLNSLDRSEDLSPEKLAYEIWVLTDGSHVPVLSMYRGERRYELVTYARD